MGELVLSRFFKLITFSCLVILLVSCGGGGSGNHPSASAEELVSVKISGRILDSRGMVVSGATVAIANDPSIGITSNQWGEFSGKVSAGDHLMTVTSGSTILFQKKFTARAGFTSALGDLSPNSPYVADDTGEDQTDAEAISSFWETFQLLYALTPSDTAVTAWVESRTADDFVKSGLTRADLIAHLINEPYAHVGKIITAVIVEEQNVQPSYAKGYLVRIRGFDSRDMVELMVFDGTSWLWSGDRRWLEASIRSISSMWVDPSGILTFSSGFELSLENDDSNYAYNHGVRSAVVSGPGLPSGGLVFEYQASNTWLSIHDSSDSSYYPLSDASINGIVDDAEYTFTFYADSADDLMDKGTDQGTVLQVFRENVPKPPIPGSLLDDSMFASPREPAAHDISDLNFGGDIAISWTKPAGTVSGEVLLIWSASSGEYQLEYDNSAGSSSITLDSSGLPPADGWAGLFIRVTDRYDRDYNLGWFF
jgi:hypothetical protein